jgi:hypothetical protein
MPAPQRADRGTDGGGSHERPDAERIRGNDLGGRAVFVEQHGEGHVLVFDEGDGVPPPSGADGGHPGPGSGDLVVSIADLTGPLAAGESAEVTQEEEGVGLLGPQIAEAVLGPLRIDENLLGETDGIERHDEPPGWDSASGC